MLITKISSLILLINILSITTYASTNASSTLVENPPITDTATTSSNVNQGDDFIQLKGVELPSLSSSPPPNVDNNASVPPLPTPTTPITSNPNHNIANLPDTSNNNNIATPEPIIKSPPPQLPTIPTLPDAPKPKDIVNSNDITLSNPIIKETDNLPVSNIPATPIMSSTKNIVDNDNIAPLRPPPNVELPNVDISANHKTDHNTKDNTLSNKSADIYYNTPYYNYPSNFYLNNNLSYGIPSYNSLYQRVPYATPFLNNNQYTNTSTPYGAMPYGVTPYVNNLPYSSQYSGMPTLTSLNTVKNIIDQSNVAPLIPPPNTSPSGNSKSANIARQTTDTISTNSPRVINDIADVINNNNNQPNITPRIVDPLTKTTDNNAIIAPPFVNNKTTENNTTSSPMVTNSTTEIKQSDLTVNTIPSNTPNLQPPPKSSNNAKSHLTKEQFINNETKMLLLDNDEVVLGKLSPEADTNDKDFFTYAKPGDKTDANTKELEIKNYDVTRNFQRKQDIRRFINTYHRNKAQPITATISYAKAINAAFCAIANNDLTTLRVLLDYYPILQATNHNGNNLLHYAIKMNNYPISKFLIMRGIDTALVNKNNQSPLTMALQHNACNIINLIKTTPQKRKKILNCRK